MGIFVCTGGFTSDAESEARTKETRKLTLLDLEKLVDLWVSNYEKIEAPLFGMTLPKDDACQRLEVNRVLMKKPQHGSPC